MKDKHGQNTYAMGIILTTSDLGFPKKGVDFRFVYFINDNFKTNRGFW